MEVAQEVIDDIPEADKKNPPWFGYEKFGESNIDFWIWVQATDRLASFSMKTEIMKRLHSRFKLEGIDINYPMRHILLPEGEGPSTFPPIVAGLRLSDLVSARRWIATLVGFAGVMIMVRPGHAGIDPVVLIAIVSALTFAVANVLIRLISDTEPPNWIQF